MAAIKEDKNKQFHEQKIIIKHTHSPIHTHTYMYTYGNINGKKRHRNHLVEDKTTNLNKMKTNIIIYILYL